MTPKERADYLIGKFREVETELSLDGGYTFEHTDRDDAVKYALITVNELLNVLFQHHEIDYWKEVRTELMKL